MKTCKKCKKKYSVKSWADMLSALKHSLPYMEHALKFFRYQHAGKEFYPNREEAEANIAEVTAAIRKAERRG